MTAEPLARPRFVNKNAARPELEQASFLDEPKGYFCLKDPLVEQGDEVETNPMSASSSKLRAALKIIPSRVFDGEPYSKR